MIDLWQKYHCPGNVVLKQKNIWKCQHQLAEESTPLTKYLLVAAFWFIPLSEYIPIKQKYHKHWTVLSTLPPEKYDSLRVAPYKIWYTFAQTSN